jgi:hypothetical protein
MAEGDGKARVSVSPEEEAIIAAPLQNNYTMFLEGPAGSGKTSLAIERVRYLVRHGAPTAQSLVLVPQRTLGLPYEDALQSGGMPPGVPVEVATVGGLVRHHVELFWPLVAQEAGFSEPSRPPVFLNLETTQYYMQRVTGLSPDTRGFEGVTITRHRLVSQLIDNLNKSALAGFPAEHIAERLKGAWAGESSRHRVFEQAQEQALAFRRYCLQHNLLDFSLQLDVFTHQVLPLEAFRAYLFGRFRYLVVDNVEENPPVTHDLLREWLARCETALVVYDSDGGYRAFLGADPESAHALREVCRQTFHLSGSHVMSDDVDALRVHLSTALNHPTSLNAGNAGQAFSIMSPVDAPAETDAPPADTIPRFQPQMLEAVAREIGDLVCERGVPPREIVVLAPFLSDALRFALSDRLRHYGVQVRSHRPSRALREEPATRCLLTLAALAHPHWRMAPGHEEVAQAMLQVLSGLDWVRATLLVQIVYRSRDGSPYLTSFEQIGTEAQERLTYSIGERYEEFRRWLEGYQERGSYAELDHFFSLMFDELLSRKGFGFHDDLDAAGQTANLIESVRRFRQVASGSDWSESRMVGPEYVDMVRQGILAAQYEWGWRVQPDEAVLLAPAYTFLMYNRPVSYQFWINVGSSGWWERIYQPLTHPYVLSRGWAAGTVWTDANELEARQLALYRLVVGLLRRCRGHVYLGMSRLSEQGYEETGPLLLAVGRVKRQLASQTEDDRD